jgi:uncharacterized HAD superfamily protein
LTDLELLKEHLELAKQFSSLFANFTNPTDEELHDTTRRLSLGLISEVVEVLNATNWKVHRLASKSIQRSELLEELVDCYLYWLSLAALWKFTPEEIQNMVSAKNMVNWQRYQQDSAIRALKSSKNIAVLDIDGVLCAYPENLIAFMNKEFNLSLTLNDITDINQVEEAYAIRGVDPLKFRLAKERFIESGGFNELSEPLPFAQKLTQYLSENNYAIVLLTARNIEKHSRIYIDTVSWLNRHSIKFDIILFDKEKDLAIIKKLEQVRLFIDDDPDIIEKVAAVLDSTATILLADRPYNKAYPIPRYQFTNNSVIWLVQRLKNQEVPAKQVV